MALLEMLSKAWRLVGSNDEHAEPWANDEEAFENHFGVDYEGFAEAVRQLDRAQHDLYEKTLEVNPEAAVAWIVFISSDE